MIILALVWLYLSGYGERSSAGYVNEILMSECFRCNRKETGLERKVATFAIRILKAGQCNEALTNS